MNNLTTIDARGLACPQPVLETKKALETGISGPLRVLVDNSTSKENVIRFARNQGCAVEIQEGEPEQFQITILKCGEPAEPRAAGIAALSGARNPTGPKRRLYRQQLHGAGR